MTIKHDQGATFILAHCTLCPSWNRAALTKMAAHLEGAEHERTVHPRSWRARKAAHGYAKRHAKEFMRIRSMKKFTDTIDAWDFGAELAPPQR